jgi:hypothetical protein
MIETSLIASQLMETQVVQASQAATLPALTVSRSYYFRFGDGETPSSRYVLAGSLATLALGTVLAGCRSDPAPAPIPHESSLPPNQGNCPPGTRDPFCLGYKGSVVEMRREREEGHHTDQALTAWLLGITVLLVGVPSAIMIVRRGRKIKRLQAELKAARPDTDNPPPQSGFFGRLLKRTPKTEGPAAPEASSENPPEDSPQNSKVGS